MKCDLHVHSAHSCTVPVAILRHFFLESYSAPADVYATLRKRGMNLVTLTDHDSIGGAEELRRHPDFFISEEATCTMPSGTQVHVGVYDITAPIGEGGMGEAGNARDTRLDRIGASKRLKDE